MPAHHKELAAVELVNDHMELSVDQWKDDEGREYTALHLKTDESSMTADGARRLAAALIKGAALIDRAAQAEVLNP